MPIATTKDGLAIRYEVTGTGPALLLISGTGHDHTFWAGQIEPFAATFRTISFDNRGTGQSAMPPPGTTLGDMADDAACVLDALGVEHAHVMGFSMGGNIAQEFAIRHRNRTISLGIHHSWARCDPRLAGFQNARLRLAERGEVEALADLSLLGIYDADWYHERLEEMAQRRRRMIDAMRTHTLPGWIGQLAACLTSDTRERLHLIEAPTLVTCSDRDMICPPYLSQEIHRLIEGSRFVLLEGTGHVALIEQPAAFAHVCLDFLRT